jgi:hypothetical protein
MRKHILLGVSAVVILATGCASMDDTQRRTATGAGVGALAGAVIGSRSTQRRTVEKVSDESASNVNPSAPLREKW